MAAAVTAAASSAALAAAAAAATASAGGGTAVLWWLRKGLRLHDNLALAAALHPTPTALYPVFILDPWFASPLRVGTNRYGHLLETLADLDASLRARGSRLFVVRGRPADVLPALWRAWGITAMAFERDIEPYAIKRDAEVLAAAATAGITVTVAPGHTLYDPDAVLARCGGKPPLTYEAFRRIIATMPQPPRPIAAPAALPSAAACRPGLVAELGPAAAGLPDGATAADTALDAAYRVPSLADLGYDPAEHTTPFRGGETGGWRSAAANCATPLALCAPPHLRLRSGTGPPISPSVSSPVAIHL